MKVFHGFSMGILWQILRLTAYCHRKPNIIENPKVFDIEYIPFRRAMKRLRFC